MDINFIRRFAKGLKEYGVDYEDVVNNWKYCGGDYGAHLRYFRLTNPNMTIHELEPQKSCVCGHKIRRNCYISKDENILVLGSCCIRRFMKNSTRTCSNCGAKHKNRKYDLCNKCKPKH